MKLDMNIAIYVRVSSRAQDQRSQLPDLQRWVKAYAGGVSVKWYRDKATGKNMDRPGWRQLEADLWAGRISRIVVWRLDRLGRTASGLTALFEQLRERKIDLVSVRDGLDLGTAAGRLMANVLASVAAYENEVRSERIVAGQSVARAHGKRWGGSRSGRRKKVTRDQQHIIRQMNSEEIPITRIANTVGLSRPTVYSVLEETESLCMDGRRHM